MSEFLNSNRDRLEALTDFARGLIKGENGRALINKYQNEISTVNPYEAMYVFDNLLQEGINTGTVKAYAGKIINVFYKSLNAYSWKKPASGHFLFYMMLENREAEKLIGKMRTEIKTFFHGEDPDKSLVSENLRRLTGLLNQYELHYIKKENILFPYLEKTFPQYRCIQIMWSFHDDFRRSIRELEDILMSSEPDEKLLSKVLGNLFFVVLPIIFREEQIVFPVAYKALPHKAWEVMMDQSHETGWCFIEPPGARAKNDIQTGLKDLVNLKTGLLSQDQIILLLNNLPVDITYVDENDEVVYFSSGTHRIFPRSNAIIGRKVQNCHPPDSVHIVNKIIDAFKTGKQDIAEFWINTKGRFIHIRYFALRNEQRDYRGVIEVSQDVTDIRKLEGERRLPDW